MTIKATRFTVTDGNATKSFMADKNGLPIKDISKMPYMNKGIAKTIHLDDLSALGEQFISLKSDQCLCYGVMKNDDDSEREIIANRDLQPNLVNTISRTREHFLYQNQAIAYFDFDGDSIDWYETVCKQNKIHAKLTPEHAVELIHHIMPEIKDVQFLARYSASSAFKDKKTGQWIIPPKSFHLYFVVNDGENIPLLKDLIMRRMWLEGYGYIQLSKPSARTGVCSRLVRCIVDCAVWQPERVDFCSGAQYSELEPFYQDLPKPVLLGGTSALTVNNLLPVEGNVLKKVTRAQNTLKGKLKKEVVSKLTSFIKKKEPQLSDFELNNKVNEAIVQHENATLNETDIIHFSNGKSYTVKELVNMPLKHGKHPLEEIATCADPDEPDYNGGICAYFNWNNGKPTIYSFAHGGRLYKFNIKPEVEKNEMNNVVPLRDANVKETKAKKDTLVEIQVNSESYLHDRVIPSIEAIAKANKDCALNFYIRDNEIVNVVKIQMKKSTIERKKLMTVGTKRMSRELARVADYHVLQNDGMKIGVAPPTDVVNDVMESVVCEGKFPIITKIIYTPQYSSEGKLIYQNGYDEDSGFYLDTDIEITPDDIKPDNDGLNFAKELLEELVVDFPFDTESDKHNALAMLILPFVREMIAGPTPLHFFNAPVPGTGKSLLAESLALVADPFVATRNFDNSKRSVATELEQKIFSILNSNTTHGFFDNVEGYVKSAELERVLTGEWTSSRLLFKQEDKRVLNLVTWVITVNHCTLSKDLTRRCIEIYLDSGFARPAEMQRNFLHPELKLWVHENRRDLICAILILVESWKLNNRYEPKLSPQMGSFEQWRKIIGGILENAGFNSLLQNRQATQMRAGDQNYEDWVEFAEAWYGKHPNEWVGASDLAEIAFSLDMQDSIFATAKKTTRGIATVVGRRIKYYLLEPLGDLKLEQVKIYNQTKYLVHKLDEEFPKQPY